MERMYTNKFALVLLFLTFSKNISTMEIETSNESNFQMYKIEDDKNITLVITTNNSTRILLALKKSTKTKSMVP